MPCFFQVSVQKGMKHSLAPAPRALPSCEFMEDAFRHKPVRHRIQCKIYNADNNHDADCYNVFGPSFQANRERGR